METEVQHHTVLLLSPLENSPDALGNVNLTYLLRSHPLLMRCSFWLKQGRLKKSLARIMVHGTRRVRVKVGGR